MHHGCLGRDASDGEREEEHDADSANSVKVIQCCISLLEAASYTAPTSASRCRLSIVGEEDGDKVDLNMEGVEGVAGRDPMSLLRIDVVGQTDALAMKKGSQVL